MKFLKGIINMFSSGDEQTGERDLGRNESCWCGSGKKYKKCHLIEDEKKAGRRRLPVTARPEAHNKLSSAYRISKTRKLPQRVLDKAEYGIPAPFRPGATQGVPGGCAFLLANMRAAE